METSRKLVGVVAVLASATLVLASDTPLDSRDWREYPEDYSALRMELGWADDYRARCERDYPVGKLSALMRAGQWTETVESGRLWLEGCPVDIRVHEMVRIALAELGRSEESEVHFRWVKGLLESVASSGDGQSTETAYITISIPEGYAVMHLLGLRVLERSVTTASDGRIVADVFAVEDSQGSKSTLHFKPEAHFARIRHDEAKWPPDLARKISETTPGVDGPEDIDRLRKSVKDFPPELMAEIWAATGLTGQDKGRNWNDYPDFSSLRREIGWRDDFFDICESDSPFNELRALIRDGKPSEAASLGRGWLEQCPVGIRVHHLTYVALAEAGEPEEGELHRDWAQGLLDSILATGDGRTPETAFVTISVGEGYALLYLLRLQLVDRTTIKDEVGRPVGDVLIVKDNEGNEFPLHFSPKAHFARIQAASESLPPELFRRLEEAIGPPPDDPEEARKAMLKWIRSLPPEEREKITARLRMQSD